MSRPTASELRWPMDDESRRQAEVWAVGVSAQVLGWTWSAFDALCANVLNEVDMSQPLEQLERDLTSKHFIEIQRIFGAETEGFSSILPHHEFPENESRPGGSGKPPASDISFVWYENQRVSWPVEAKVVPTPGSLSEYLGDTKKFVDGIAAPLVGEGAQIAYLLTGKADSFFDNLRTLLPSPLASLPEFSERAHLVSSHARTSHPDLQLHHMAMCCCRQGAFFPVTLI
jgi:hypothetical protein